MKRLVDVALSVAGLAAVAGGIATAVSGGELEIALYVVGLTRPTPLTPRQAHAIRLACRHALGDTLGSTA